jgi:hypothetical protein
MPRILTVAFPIGLFVGNYRVIQRVVIANPLQVKAIAHAQVKTDKVDVSAC